MQHVPTGTELSICSRYIINMYGKQQLSAILLICARHRSRIFRHEVLVSWSLSELHVRIQCEWLAVSITLAVLEWQAAAGYDMAEVNLAGRDPVSGESADPRYMSLQRLQKRISESTRPVTAIEVRQFLYDEIGLKKLFTGCGTTHNDDGNPG